MPMLTCHKLVTQHEAGILADEDIAVEGLGVSIIVKLLPFNMLLNRQTYEGAVLFQGF